MKENKGTTVLLTVIGIATLLVAVVGATFAYFSATVVETDPENDNKDVVVEAATVGTITFTHGNTIDLCDDTKASPNCLIYPGAQEAKTFTVEADANSTVPVEYTVYLVVDENDFVTDNLGYKVSAVTEGGTPGTVLPNDLAADYKPLNTTTAAPSAQIKLGTAKLGTAGAKDTWTLDVRLKNLENENQTADQGKIFNARIVVEATNNVYSATGGTTAAAGN